MNIEDLENAPVSKWICPECNSSDLRIFATVAVEVTINDVDNFETDTDLNYGTTFDENSGARCVDCGHSGNLDQFEKAASLQRFVFHYVDSLLDSVDLALDDIEPGDLELIGSNCAKFAELSHSIGYPLITVLDQQEPAATTTTSLTKLARDFATSQNDSGAAFYDGSWPLYWAERLNKLSGCFEKIEIDRDHDGLICILGGYYRRNDGVQLLREYV